MPVSFLHLNLIDLLRNSTLFLKKEVEFISWTRRQSFTEATITLDKSLATLNKILASSSAARFFNVDKASTSSSLLSKE